MLEILLPLNIFSPVFAMSAAAKGHSKKSTKCVYYYYNTDLEQLVRDDKSHKEYTKLFNIGLLWGH